MQCSALLFAAGNSQRFEGIKQLAQIDQQKLIERSFSFINANVFEQCFVVLGQYYNTILANSQLPRTSIIHAKSAHLGFGHSISEAISHVPADCTHVLIALADQVDLTTAHFKQLKALSSEYPEHIICAQTQHGLSAPAIFPKKYFTALAQLSGDKGAKAVLLNNKAQVKPLILPQAEVDIDTQEQLMQWQQRQCGMQNLTNDSYHKESTSL